MARCHTKMPPRAVCHPARLELRAKGPDCLKTVGAMQHAVVPVPLDFELPHLITVVVSPFLRPARSLVAASSCMALAAAKIFQVSSGQEL